MKKRENYSLTEIAHHKYNKAKKSFKQKLSGVEKEI